MGFAQLNISPTLLYLIWEYYPMQTHQLWIILTILFMLIVLQYSIIVEDSAEAYGLWKSLFILHKTYLWNILQKLCSSMDLTLT